MAAAARIMSQGLPAEAAKAMVGSVATGLTAAGSTQATALALGSDDNWISTAAASTGVILPANATAGDEVFVYNGGANSVTVYPPVGGTINNLSANTGLALATLKSGKYKSNGALGWSSLLSA